MTKDYYALLFTSLFHENLPENHAYPLCCEQRVRAWSTSNLSFSFVFIAFALLVFFHNVSRVFMILDNLLEAITKWHL